MEIASAHFFPFMIPQVMTCVKLLKPYNGGELVFTGIKSSNRAELGDDVLGVELVAELPAEQQVFSMIHNAGQEGIHMAQVLFPENLLFMI